MFFESYAKHLKIVVPLTAVSDCTASSIPSPALLALRAAASVRARPAEIDQQPVIHELCGETVEARDDADAAILIGPDQSPVAFGIELGRQSNRGNPIAA